MLERLTFFIDRGLSLASPNRKIPIASRKYSARRLNQHVVSL